MVRARYLEESTEIPSLDRRLMTKYSEATGQRRWYATDPHSIDNRSRVIFDAEIYRGEK